MKSIPILVASAACAALAACQGASQRGPGAAASAPWVGEEIRRAAVERAIVVQRTLFPYHFADGSAELNALGMRDLRVLARHYAAHGGTLQVRRGGAPAELYDARVAAVTRALAAAGLAEGRVALGAGFPGGDGAPSERVIAIATKPTAPFGDVGASGSGPAAAAPRALSTSGGNDR